MSQLGHNSEKKNISTNQQGGTALYKQDRVSVDSHELCSVC